MENLHYDVVFFVTLSKYLYFIINFIKYKFKAIIIFRSYSDENYGIFYSICKNRVNIIVFNEVYLGV